MEPVGFYSNHYWTMKSQKSFFLNYRWTSMDTLRYKDQVRGLVLLASGTPTGWGSASQWAHRAVYRRKGDCLGRHMLPVQMDGYEARQWMITASGLSTRGIWSGVDIRLRAGEGFRIARCSTDPCMTYI